MVVEQFRLPIETLVCVQKIEPNIVTDIELSEKDGGKSMYRHLFRCSNKHGVDMIESWNKVWTNDTKYLKDTKRMLKKYDNNTTSIVCESWDKLKANNRFNEKYYYIEWDFFKFLNNHAPVLQLLSVYRLLSPICTLVLPIIIMLSSWFILRLSGVKMDFYTFVGFLKKYISTQTTLGKMSQNFSTAKMSSKCYAVFSIVMYFVQIYNNVMTVVNFNKNLSEMHLHIRDIGNYMKETVKNMKTYLAITTKYSTYKTFNTELASVCGNLEDMIHKIGDIPITHKSMRGFYHTGYVQKMIYCFYNDEDLNRTMDYSFGFNGYIDNLNGLKSNLIQKRIAYCKFNTSKSTGFTDAYYPPLLDDKDVQPNNIVKNSYKLDKELLVSGPNASGKTTLLKTTLFNIICSQQMGVGFYRNANIKVYSNMFCYLNIPDTSGRDSLFQAEARRCIDIINKITESPKDHTFCIFDELYSGTNHYEAVSSAHSFLNYLVTKYDFHFMMSTHFIDLCVKLAKNNDSIRNMKMDVSNSGDDFVYSYKIKNGISDVKGGVKVLKDLNYPQDIIKNTQVFLDTEF